MSNIDNVPTVATTSSALALLQGNKVNRTSGGGKPFLKFDAKRTGSWLLGNNAEERSDEVFSLDVESLKHGWISWQNKRATKSMVAINEILPVPLEPVDGNEAAEARSFEGTFSDGTEFLYECSTFGGRKAIDALLAEMFQRAQAESPFIFPQVKLEGSSYEHSISSYGTVLEPVLTAVSWFDQDGNQEGENLIEAPDEEEEAAPPRRRTRK